MISFKEAEILNIMPENMKGNPKYIALSYALKKANMKLISCAEQTSIYAIIDNMPDKILDVLAIELRTQFYDTTLSIEKKRSLVKNTMKWYQKAGTTAAVQEMIDNVFESGTVLEWYETGGEPGTFTISTNDTINLELIAEFNKVISKVKNVRSHLDSVIVGNRANVNIGVAVGIGTHKSITIQ